MNNIEVNTHGLIVQGIGKAYKNKKVLHEVNLELHKGEVVALLGPNGAGKTTCFYSIAGLISPDKGSVTVDGFDATNLPMYRRAQLGLGYLPQEASIFRGLNVEQNISAVSELWAKDKI
ncbi:MAG: ATP-binding cassette domain-containing protein, partial [Amylibacter sp.]